MRLLQVTNLYPTRFHPIFGIFIKDQLDDLASAGIDFDLFFINAKEKGKLEYLRSYQKLKKVIKNYDIIHCHHYLSAFIVSLINPKGKVIVSFTSDGPNEFMLPKNWINNCISRTIYKFIINRSDIRIFKNKIPENLTGDSNSHLIPNGVNQAVFYPITKNISKGKLNLDRDKKYILFVSSQDINRPEKRYDLFLKVIEELRKKFKNIEPLIAANIPRNELIYYYNSAELHLLTSDFEGSPNSVKESLACNTPVVSTNVGNVSEMLEGLENCFISPDNDPAKLAKYCLKSISYQGNIDIASVIKKKKLDNVTAIQNILNLYDKM